MQETSLEALERAHAEMRTEMSGLHRALLDTPYGVAAVALSKTRPIRALARLLLRLR